MFSRASRTSARCWKDSRAPSSDSAMRMPAVIVASCTRKSFHEWIGCGGWMSTGAPCAHSLRQLVDVGREQLAQPGEPRVFLQVGSRVAERPRHVLDVH